MSQHLLLGLCPSHSVPSHGVLGGAYVCRHVKAHPQLGPRERAILDHWAGALEDRSRSSLENDATF